MAGCMIPGSVSTTRHAAVEFRFSSCGDFKRECSLLRSSTRRVVALAATGFGKRPETKPKPRIPKEFDLKTAERIEVYKLFVRGVTEEDEEMKWEEIGDLLVEPGANVEGAIKERRNVLAAAVNEQHPSLQGKPVEFGYKARPEAGDDDENEDEPPSDEEPVVSLDLSGKPTEEKVLAILRLKKVEDYYKSLERPRPLRAPAFLSLNRRQRSQS